MVLESDLVELGSCDLGDSGLVELGSDEYARGSAKAAIFCRCAPTWSRNCDRFTTTSRLVDLVASGSSELAQVSSQNGHSSCLNSSADILHRFRQSE